MQLNKPISGVSSNILLGLRSSDMEYVEAGQTLNDLAPKSPDMVVCRLNGSPYYISRESWGYQVQPNDIVQWEVYPGSRDILRPILQIVVAVLSAIYGPWVGIFGSILINLLLPPTVKQLKENESPSPTFSTSLAGNTARLYEPIPKVCGRHLLVPPFAAQPYSEFDVNGDQYYYALLTIGVGVHEIERSQIDDTTLSHFQDVLVRNYLPRGSLPTTVLANVVTSPEVSGSDMPSNKYIGGYAASGPQRAAASIGIDVIAPRGLGYQEDDGSISNATVTFDVEYRNIDDFGAPVSNWAVLASESKTAALTKAQRWSFKYALATPYRVEVRIIRTDTRNTSGRALHDITWLGLRAYLQAEAPLNPEVAHYEVVLRASEQLSQLTQRSVNFIVRAFTHTWTPSGGWSDWVHTRNPAWWILELATNSVWGLGLPASRIDVQSFYDLSLIWEDRQDRFDYVFDTTVDAWDAMQLIARAGRARVFRRNGILTIARDGADDLPVTAFTPRNTIADSMVTTETMSGFNEPDGIILEYFSNRTWTYLPIEIPLPITAVTSPMVLQSPVRIRLPGITGFIHAHREGLYEAARMAYRRRTVQCVTEMQGMLPAYMSVVRWMPELTSYGQSGDVMDFDSSTMVMTLSERPQFDNSSPSTSTITFIRNDGSLTDRIDASPGVGEFEIVIAEAPDFDLSLNDPNSERTKCLFGTTTSSDEMVKLVSLSDGGLSDSGVQLIRIAGVVDDQRVHEADNYLLPAVGSPSDIQDPVNDAADDTDSPYAFLSVALRYHRIFALGYTVARAAYYLLSDGRSNQHREDNYSTTTDPSTDFYRAGEWLSYRPVSTAISGLYSVRCTLVFGTLTLDSSLADGATWMNLATDRMWAIEELVDNLTQTAQIFLEVRLDSSGIVQSSATIDLAVENFQVGVPPSGDGSGDSTGDDQDASDEGPGPGGGGDAPDGSGEGPADADGTPGDAPDGSGEGPADTDSDDAGDGDDAGDDDAG